MDDDDALAFFDVEHSSVRVTLRDPAGAEKVLHLSPVILAACSEYFARLLVPGELGPEPRVIDVFDIECIVAVFRSFYSSRAEVPGGTFRAVEVLKFCDEMMLRRRCVQSALASLARSLFDASFFVLVETLYDLAPLCESHVGKFREFDDATARIVLAMFRSKPEKMAKALGVLSSPRFRAVCLWAVYETSGEGTVPPPGRRELGMSMIIDDLQQMTVDEDAIPHLERLLERPTLRVFDYERVDRILTRLSKIKGDELSGSRILRARDLIYARLQVNARRIAKRPRDDAEK